MSARARVDSVSGDGGIVGVVSGGARQGRMRRRCYHLGTLTKLCQHLSHLQFVLNILRKPFTMTCITSCGAERVMSSDLGETSETFIC